MQSRGVFSPALGSSCTTKPGTHVCFPSPLVTPISLRPHGSFTYQQIFPRASLLALRDKSWAVLSAVTISLVAGVGTTPIAWSMKNGDIFPDTSPNSAPLVFCTQNKCCRLQMPAEKEEEGNGEQAPSSAGL